MRSLDGPAKAELIVALDMPELESALQLVDRLRGYTRWYKVGLELFSAAGPGAVKALRAKGCQVFLDLKYLDIPNTVQSAVRVASRLGAAMLTVHLSGGQRMIRSALEGAREGTPESTMRPLVIGVTVLTSLNREDIAWMGGQLETPVQESTSAPEYPCGISPGELARRLAEYGRQWGVDGVVCSALETPGIKSAQGSNFICVTPGIRLPTKSLPGIDGDDQSRTLAPGDAVASGADFLVVGRPITRAAVPEQAVEAILHSMAETTTKGGTHG